jgi:magnesium chelatase family protein
VDLQLAVRQVTLNDFVEGAAGESSAVVAARVAEARQAQSQRLSGWGCATNSEVRGRVLRNELRLPRTVTAALDRALDRNLVSARGWDRVLRVAWTIADLGGHSAPDADDVSLALGFRLQERAA